MSAAVVPALAEVVGCSLGVSASSKETQSLQNSLSHSGKQNPLKLSRQRCNLCCKPSALDIAQDAGSQGERRRTSLQASESGAEKVAAAEEWTDPWLERLPPDTSPIYSHSLLCIEAWLRKLGFVQVLDDPAWWTIMRDDWHAELRLDVVDISVTYLKAGPGKLPRDIEKRWSYGLSRRDFEAAIMAGP
ncbi:hypothetical protein KFL_011460010 [Klebsormidium nitens]|uniref:Uncharacterized protein n=1 Tax=Klebsormidium nitens TaxID=105231 RepID=A0A1Y1IPI3_KLENI|nr:hypothetical protein KFL_011460010 [Klebsormidium nitens]|eukprot:GAQ92805.1 hypothetical protein KFL_011460010 [Klebsormidium nitens]